MTKKKKPTEAGVRDIRGRTHRKFSPEEKIRIVLEGLRGEQSIASLCRPTRVLNPAADSNSPRLLPKSSPRASPHPDSAGEGHGREENRCLPERRLRRRVRLHWT
jgi:transposase-like protein